MREKKNEIVGGRRTKKCEILGGPAEEGPAEGGPGERGLAQGGPNQKPRTTTTTTNNNKPHMNHNHKHPTIHNNKQPQETRNNKHTPTHNNTDSNTNTNTNPTTTKMDWPKNGLAKIGWPNGLAKNGLAKIGLTKVGHYLGCCPSEPASISRDRLSLDRPIVFESLVCQLPQTMSQLSWFPFLSASSAPSAFPS